MTESFGNFSIMAALLCAALAILFAAASVSRNSQAFMRTSRWLIAAFAASLTITSAALLYALINNQFQFEYVAGYTESALPLSYKIAAFWAGQSGSLLFWAWTLGMISTVAVFTQRKTSLKQQAGIIYTLAITCGLFAILMAYVPESNPFKLLPQTPPEGRGLNPMLQDPAMIAHPPILFIGYAGFTVPFAIMMGAFYANRTDSDWLAPARNWLVFSWLFLTVGILLGSWWAYVELGWGGYWAWDPVENASLLPWLTATAVLHSIIAQQQRNMFRTWNAILIALTFLLCIFATYLTRSGIMSAVSVHSFPASSLGTVFLFFMGFTAAATAAMLIAKRNILAKSLPMQNLVSREGAFLAGNVLLLIIMLTTAVGTLIPAITAIESVQDFLNIGAKNVTQPFYNTVVVPMGMILIAIMTLGPILKSGPDAGEKLIKTIIPPVLIAAIICVVAYFLIRSDTTTVKILGWSLVCIAVCVIGLYNIAADFVSQLRTRKQQTNQSVFAAALRMIDANHRRYGGQFAHFGVLLIVVGITGSSLYNVEKQHELKPGESVTVNGHTVKLESFQKINEVNYTASQATVLLTTADGKTSTLTPQNRSYNGWKEQPNSEVAIQSSWKGDIYLILAAWMDDGSMVAVKVIINPLVTWLWIGSLVMTLAGIFCLTPRLLPATQTQPAAAPKPAAVYQTFE